MAEAHCAKYYYFQHHSEPRFSQSQATYQANLCAQAWTNSVAPAKKSLT